METPGQANQDSSWTLARTVRRVSPANFPVAALNKAVALIAQAAMQAWAGMPSVCDQHVEVSSGPWRLFMHGLWVKEGQVTDQGAVFWDCLVKP